MSRAADIVRTVLVAALIASLAPATAALDHSGSVSGSWLAADSPHRVIGSVLVPAGNVLDIEPGCVVVFDDSARLLVQGRLHAAGTPAAPLAFASAGAGSPGDWKGIVLGGAGPHVIAHADISGATTAIEVDPGATLLMSDSAVSGSLGDGIVFTSMAFGTLERVTLADNGGSGVAIRDSSPTLSGCRFTGNARAAWISGASFPHLSGLVALSNAAGDGIVLDTLMPVTGYGSFRDGGIPYIVPDGGSLTIGSQSDVTVWPGVVLKMGLGARVIVEGSLATAGTAADPVLVTSLRDDSIAGDTNGDGAATLPGKGDWDAFEVTDTGLLRLQRTTVRLADDAVRALGGDTVLTDSDIREAAWRGAAFGPLARGFVLGTSFTDCETGLQVGTAANVVAGLPGGGPGAGGRNAFTCNVSYDVENLDAATLPVHDSWFGPYGPDPLRLGGPVDAGMGLPQEPERIDLRRMLALSRPDPALVRFAWESAGSCATHLLGVAERPDGSFQVLARSPEPEFTASLASLGTAPLLYFALDVETGMPSEGNGAP